MTSVRSSCAQISDSPQATQSLAIEVSPAATAYPPAISITAPHTVSDAYYSIAAEAYPFASNPLQTPIADNDGFPDAQEASFGSDPNSPDTDGDGQADSAVD